MAFIRRDSFGRLLLGCRYDPQIVAEIRSIASSDKSWNAETKVWTFSPGTNLNKIAGLLRLTAPAVIPAGILDKTVTVEYIGACKQRADQTISAYGWANKDWDVVFPERVLRAWFKDGPAIEHPTTAASTDAPKPTQAKTLYGVLLLDKKADADAIKAGYRRMARQTHPDVNKEPDAREQFERVKKAYDILSDPQKRKRYDLGLKLAPPAGEPKPRVNAYEVKNYAQMYRAPLRTGVITGKIVVRARLEFQEITSWEDVKDSQGRVLVTSWPQGADFFESKWVDANYFSG